MKIKKSVLSIFIAFALALPSSVGASALNIDTPINGTSLTSDVVTISGSLTVDPPNPNADKTHYIKIYVNGASGSSYLPNGNGSGYKYSTQTDSSGNWTYTTSPGQLPCGGNISFTVTESTEFAYFGDISTLPIISPGYYSYMDINGSDFGTEGSITGPYGGFDMTMRDPTERYIFMAYLDFSGPDNRFSVVDTFTNTEVANFSIGLTSGFAAVTSISEDGNTLYVQEAAETATDYTIGQFFEMDISNPASPSLTGTIPFTSWSALTVDMIPETNIVGNYAYLPTTDRENIEVYDVSGGPTSNPSLVNTYNVGTTTLGLRLFAAVNPAQTQITFFNQDTSATLEGMLSWDLTSDPTLTGAPTFTAVPAGPNIGVWTPDGSRFIMTEGNANSGDPDAIHIMDSSFTILDSYVLTPSISVDNLGVFLNQTGTAQNLSVVCLLAATGSSQIMFQLAGVSLIAAAVILPRKIRLEKRL